MNGQNRVLVTGAAGFLGVPLTAELLRRGHRVLAVDTDYFGTLGSLTAFDSVTIRRADFRSLTVSDLTDVDGVIHLAAIPNDPSGDLFAEEVCQEINGHAVGRLAEICLEANCKRFVLMSTCSVYGSKADSDAWCDEDSPLEPGSAYARAKVVAERSVRSASDRGLSTVILRGSTLYGASGARTRFDLPVNRFCLQAYWHGHVYAVARALWRPLVTVVDAAHALARCVEAPDERIGGLTLNLGRTDFNWRLGHVADVVAQTFAVPVSEVPLGRDSRSYRVRSDRLAGLLPEAVPTTSIEEGIRSIQYALRTGRFPMSAGHTPRCNAQKGYLALLATGELDGTGRPPRAPFGVPTDDDCTAR